MRYAHVWRIGVAVALAVALLHSVSARTLPPQESDTYRNPNPDAELKDRRVKCSDAGPMKKYLANISVRQKALREALAVLEKELLEGKTRQKDAQREADRAVTGETRGQQTLAQEKVAAAATEVAKIEGEIRAKNSELAKIPIEKTNTLKDIKQLCDVLPGDTGGCVTDNSQRTGAGTCR
jgi:hypothetical protein